MTRTDFVVASYCVELRRHFFERCNCHKQNLGNLRNATLEISVVVPILSQCALTVLSLTCNLLCWIKCLLPPSRYPDCDGGDSATLPAGLQCSDWGLGHRSAGAGPVPHSHQASRHTKEHTGQYVGDIMKWFFDSLIYRI